jgi:site-specific recombinase XerD
MSEETLLGPWIRRFLLEHLRGERNLARNTVWSYRDTVGQLISFVAGKAGKSVDQLSLDHLSAEMVRLFLVDLQESRGCGISTCNHRLAVIHAFARFIGAHNPEQIAWYGQIRAIPFKRNHKTMMSYLDKREMDALLASMDYKTAQGRRDFGLVLFLYNSGARASEAACLEIADLDFVNHAARIVGKGNKVRQCPLWPRTIHELTILTAERSSSERVFLNRCGQSITRFGIHTLIERCCARATKKAPSLAKKRISPHTIRHTAAVHLLRSGVDINTIRAWLGHVSLDTTNIYAEIDLEMKAKALAKCEVPESVRSIKRWRQDNALMSFLRSL